MRKLGLLLCFFLFGFLALAQKSDKEKALDAMIDAGMIRRDGNNLILKVPSYADTARYKLMYSGLITDPNVRLRFETTFSVATPTQSSPPISTSGLNTSGMANVRPSDLSQLPSTPVAGARSRMKTFGFVGVISPTASQQFSEHSWTVPEGVTSIQLEGWSAGADGFVGPDVNGGGGGAGAYFLSVIEVVPGTVFRIRVPAGGKNCYPLVIQSDVGSLTLISGKYPVSADDQSGRYDGRGGYLDQSSGNFSGNIFSIRGEDGERNLAIPLDRQTSNLYRYYQNGSRGGAAPRGGSGGVGAIHISLAESDVPAKDGNFPGGGGGGGLESTGIRGLESGRGAAGFLIIYY